MTKHGKRSCKCTKIQRSNGEEHGRKEKVYYSVLYQGRKKKTVQAQSFETSKVKNILRSMNNQEEKKLEEEVDKITIDWGNMGKEKTDH